MLIYIIAIVLIVLGLLGCFIHRVPGPLISFAGLILGIIGGLPCSVLLAVVCGVLVVGTALIDYLLVPRISKKVHPYGKATKWGTFIGSIIGIVITLDLDFAAGCACLLFLPLLFAFLFELVSRNAEPAKRALGGYTAYLASTLLKIAVCLFCLYAIANESASYSQEIVDEAATADQPAANVDEIFQSVSEQEI